MSFKPRDNVVQHAALDCIEHCLVDFDTWMHHNMLKVNTDKMEIKVFTSKTHHNISLTVGDMVIPSNT